MPSPRGTATKKERKKHEKEHGTTHSGPYCVKPTTSHNPYVVRIPASVVDPEQFKKGGDALYKVLNEANKKDDGDQEQDMDTVVAHNKEDMRNALKEVDADGYELTPRSRCHSTPSKDP